MRKIIWHSDAMEITVTNGKMTEGTWSREIDSTPAVYVDAQGNPIPLNPGKTWVCIIWDEYGEDVVIE